MSRTRITDKTAADFLAKTAASDSKKTKELKRDLSSSVTYKTDNVKHVADMLSALHSANASLMSASTALTDISAHEISPDGKLGGLGYVMSVRQIREDIAAATNLVSNLTDTLADELTNPKWGLGEKQIEEYKNKAKSSASEEPTGELAGLGGDVPQEDKKEEDTAAEPTDSFDDILNEFGVDAPTSSQTFPSEEPAPAPAEEPAAPAPAPAAEPATAPKVPYQKLSSYVGNPEQDPVARSLRAPILFHLLDGQTAGR